MKAFKSRQMKALVIVLVLSPIGLLAQSCGGFVGGYVPSWHDPAAIDYSGLSHSFYAFAATNNSGELLVDNLPVLGSFKTASAGTKRFLSLAGGGGADSYTAMTSSPAAIETFVNHCVSFCKANNFQGIDMDWEGIITSADSIKYGSLMRALSVKLHDNDLQLVATLGFGSYGGDFYNVGALKKADWIQLMVYDQTGTWRESPFGGHATFQQVLDAVRYWTDRGYTDLSKMVIGLPFYGYTFNSSAGGLATAITYSDIVEQHPGMNCDQDDVGLTVFNGPETIRQKVNYVKSKGLKGVMIWEMSQDVGLNNDKSLMKAITLAYCGEPGACVQNVTAVENETQTEELVQTTNPIRDVLNISLKGTTDHITRIEVIDNLGRSLYIQDAGFTSVVQVDLSHQCAGLLYVRISFTDQAQVVRRVVKI